MSFRPSRGRWPTLIFNWWVTRRRRNRRVHHRASYWDLHQSAPSMLSITLGASTSSINILTSLTNILTSSASVLTSSINFSISPTNILTSSATNVPILNASEACQALKTGLLLGPMGACLVTSLSSILATTIYRLIVSLFPWLIDWLVDLQKIQVYADRNLVDGLWNSAVYI